MVNSDDQEQWLSIGEASEFLGISRDTLRRWEKKGKVKVFRSPTNRRIYKQSDLDDLYKAKTGGAKPTQKSEPQTNSSNSDQPANTVSKDTASSNPIQTVEKVPDNKPVNTAEVTSASQSESEPGVNKQVKTEETDKNIQTQSGKAVAAESAELKTNTNDTSKLNQTYATQQKVEKEIKVSTEETRSMQMPASQVKPLDVPENKPVTPQPTASTPTQLPSTPMQAQVNTPNHLNSNQISGQASTVSEVKEETTSVNILKIIAIVLALILVGLGVTITALVFV